MATRTVTSLPHNEFPVAFGNFDKNRLPIKYVVLHSEAGYKAGTRQRFNNPASKVSACYGVNMDGSLDHYLEENFVAYHAGQYRPFEWAGAGECCNQNSIGIEHEDFDNNMIVRSDALYETSAKLLADICSFYAIPCDTTHVLKHNQVVQTKCPGTLDTNRIIARASEIMTASHPQTTTLTAPQDAQPGTVAYDQQQALKVLQSFVSAHGGNLEGTANTLVQDAYPALVREREASTQAATMPNTPVQNSSLLQSTKTIPVSLLQDILNKVSSMLMGNPNG